MIANSLMFDCQVLLCHSETRRLTVSLISSHRKDAAEIISNSERVLSKHKSTTDADQEFLLKKLFVVSVAYRVFSRHFSVCFVNLIAVK